MFIGHGHTQTSYHAQMMIPNDPLTETRQSTTSMFKVPSRLLVITSMHPFAIPSLPSPRSKAVQFVSGRPDGDGWKKTGLNVAIWILVLALAKILYSRYPADQHPQWDECNFTTLNREGFLPELHRADMVPDTCICILVCSSLSSLNAWVTIVFIDLAMSYLYKMLDKTWRLSRFSKTINILRRIINKFHVLITTLGQHIF